LEDKFGLSVKKLIILSTIIEPTKLPKDINKKLIFCLLIIEFIYLKISLFIYIIVYQLVNEKKNIDYWFMWVDR